MKFVHLSDLHYDPKNDGRESREFREKLIPYLKKCKISADELFVTGDFRFAKRQGNNQKDINEVVEYIKSIAKAIGIKDINEHVHIVPGNHDRSRIDGRKMTGVRKRYDYDSGCFDKKDLKLIKQQFNYFNRVCKTLYGPDHYWKNVQLHTYRVINGYVYLYLNTALTHNIDKDRGRLLIGNDCFDRLLREIAEKYPNLPIIILAHHSPECFDHREEHIVESIIRKNKNIFLYLCGDAHDRWERKVNNCVQITMGCLRQEKGAEETFLYGDTDANKYLAYHWVGSWELCSKANETLETLFSTTTINPPTEDTNIVSSPTPLVITIDKDGKMLPNAKLNNRLISWLGTNKADHLEVELDVLILKQLTKRCTQFENKMKHNIALNPIEEDEYLSCKKDKDRITNWSQRMKIACQCFLDDYESQFICGINNKVAYLDMLTRIINFDWDEERRKRNSHNYTTVDFIVTRTNNRQFSFTVHICNDVLWSLGLTPATLFHEIQLLTFDKFDKETKKDILVHYYLELARCIFNRDYEIKNDKQAMSLSNYWVGLH